MFAKAGQLGAPVGFMCFKVRHTLCRSRIPPGISQAFGDHCYAFESQLSFTQDHLANNSAYYYFQPKYIYTPW
jgi:hypothetical protein